jgi:hypothetical protein
MGFLQSELHGLLSFLFAILANSVLEPRLFLVNNERPNSLNYVSRP